MTRAEALARFFLVMGIFLGLVTLGFVVFRGSDDPPPSDPRSAPAAEELGTVLRGSTVIYESERDDAPGTRTIVLAVPEALNEQEAGSSVLLTLRNSGWLVSARGGAIRRDRVVCAAVSTPTAWLSDPDNRALVDEIEEALTDTRTVAVVVELFGCSKEQRE